MTESADKAKAKIVYTGSGWSLLKTSKSKNYYVVAHEAGKQRLYGSTGTDHIGTAKKVAAERYRDYLRTIAVENTEQSRLDKPKILEDHFNKYIQLQEARVVTGGIDAVTPKRVRKIWNRIAYYWANKTPEDLTEENLILFSADFEKRFPRCAFRPEHMYLTALINYLHKEGFIRNKPSFDLPKSKRRSVKTRQVISPENLKKLLLAVDKMEAQTPRPVFVRRQVQIRCGLFMGLRLSEIGKMKAKNIFQESGTWFIKLEDTKTDKDRIIKIAADALPFLLEAKEAARGKWLFEHGDDRNKHITDKTLDHDARLIFANAEVSGHVFHELRHTAITEAVKKKHDLVRVSLYFGVSVKVLLKVYAHLTHLDTLDLASSVEVIHG